MSKLIFNPPSGLAKLDDQITGTLQILETTLTFFKQSAVGPEILGDGYLPFVTDDPEPERELYRIGSFYCVAIGQGSHYNRGLFGPLPVLGSEFRAIVYSATVKDKQTFDPRMKGWNYVMACFIFHESLLPSIYKKRKEIETIFEIFFRKYQKLSTITDGTIQKLKQAITLIIQD